MQSTIDAHLEFLTKGDSLLPLNMDREEQFVLRVQEPELAERIRQLLNAPDGAKQKDALMELKFESECCIVCAFEAITCRSVALGYNALFGMAA